MRIKKLDVKKIIAITAFALLCIIVIIDIITAHIMTRRNRPHLDMKPAVVSTQYEKVSFISSVIVVSLCTRASTRTLTV